MRFRFRKPWLSALIGLPLVLTAVFLASVEWSAVSRENCDWGADQLCTDVKGFFGLAAVGITIVLIIGLLVINRNRSSYRS